MKSLEVDIKYNGISIKADFNNSLNFLVGNSGTGKTLLMKAVQLYCLNNKIKNIYCDSDCSGLTSSQIIDQCSDKEVVILDNADLYLTREILEEIQKDDDKIIIVCMKNTCNINTYYASEYVVKYKNKELTVREI